LDGWSARYINLLLNPERYTGYSGYNATKIWQAIYKENCFPGTFRDQCFEERVFYRLISGFHSSTTVHICEFHQSSGGQWEPNVPMYLARFGGFPDRLQNIYFVFVFLLRAANKAAEQLRTYDFNTGHPQEDEETRDLVTLMLQHTTEFEQCSATFDEGNMFVGAEKLQLKHEFKRKFHNISEIMDCVGCETCKVHAKLQILGIGTALKILFSDQPPTIERNEFVALVNSIHKFSESIQAAYRMEERVHLLIWSNVIKYAGTIAAALLLCAFLWPSNKSAAPAPAPAGKNGNKTKKEQ